MAASLCNRPDPLFRKGRTVILAFVWLSGLFLGSFLFVCRSGSFSSAIRGMTVSAAPMVSVVLVYLVPLFLLLICEFASRPYLLLFLCFIRAFLFGFVSLGIVLSFGASGWLLRLLLLFPGFALLPVFYWFLHRRLSFGDISFFEDFILLFLAFLLVFSLDLGFICPFLTDLLNF